MDARKSAVIDMQYRIWIVILEYRQLTGKIIEPLLSYKKHFIELIICMTGSKVLNNDSSIVLVAHNLHRSGL
jgi:hypothetical protein